MSILTDFEDRVGGALEGMFAGVFRSPVQPVEIAKALGRAMDDGKTIGVGKVYAPGSYVVALSPQDSEKLGTFKATLAGELATFLADHAREHSYHLPGKPKVTFKVHRDLRLGRFRVSADLTSAPDDEPPSTPPLRAAAPIPERATAAAPHAPSGVASVTVGEDGRRVVLNGDRVVIGRLEDCGICLADVNASRQHAAFVREGEEWAIEDLGSTNGTLLDGQPVTHEVLQDGDAVEIGVTRLVYHRASR